MDSISKDLIEHIDNGFLVHCKNKEEAIEVLHILEQDGYDLDDYSQKLLSRYGEYNENYPNMGYDGGIITWWNKFQNSHPVVVYSDIISNLCDGYEITDDEFDDMLNQLLCE